MRRISFNPRFVNEAGDDLIQGKIHTIRQNFDYWKKFEGRDVELFTWEGKPYQKGSKQKVFCVKPLVCVQKVTKSEVADFWLSLEDKNPIPIVVISKNDGLDKTDFIDWFINYPFGEMAILHFTDFRY
jgi:hypothetical protein